jgi:hypothetical protein
MIGVVVKGAPLQAEPSAKKFTVQPGGNEPGKLADWLAARL